MTKIKVSIAAFLLPFLVFTSCGQTSSELATLLGTQSSTSASFDPVELTGFIGKGDVQQAFGWNNSQLQTKATSLRFYATRNTVFAIPCRWQNEQQTVSRVFQADLPASSRLVYDTRLKGQVTGFELGGALPDDNPSIPHNGFLDCPAGWEATGKPYQTGETWELHASDRITVALIYSGQR